MLPLTVTAQGLQLVSRRRRQDAQFRRGMQLQKLPQRHTLKRTEAPGMLKVEELPEQRLYRCGVQYLTRSTKPRSYS